MGISFMKISRYLLFEGILKVLSKYFIVSLYFIYMVDYSLIPIGRK